MSTKKKTSSKIFKLIILIIVTAAIICVAFMIHNYSKLNRYSDTIITNLQNGISNPFSQDDYLKQIDNAELPDEIKQELKEDYAFDKSPLVSAVLKNSDITSSKSALKRTVTIEITAPDLSKFIETYDKKLVSNDAILNDAISYCETAEKKAHTFSITYEYENGNWYPVYNEREYANAVTGGLADEYDNLYNQWIDEQIKAMEGE